MAKGQAVAEINRDIGTESAKPKVSEQKRIAKDNLGASAALSALGKDNPTSSARSRLASLEKAGKRRYRRFDTMAQYKEAKARSSNTKKDSRIKVRVEKATASKDEAKRVYDEPDLDPLIRQTSDEIASKTNLAPDVQAAFASNEPLTINQTWFNTRNRIGAQTWGEFINKYPDKAVSYAEKHLGIKAALEESKRQEQAGAQAQTREQVQTESDQLLADSVRVSENNQAQTAEQPSENNATEVNAETEKKLLSAETAGAQATLLLGGEISAGIDRAKIEAIAGGGPINTEKANKASLSEREEYWNGENSPYKGMTFEQQLEKWRGTMQEFFDQYKGKPEAEFFRRIGIDLENENAVMEIHQTYFVDGTGDVGLLTQKIAQNNNAEQIQENKVLIEKLGKMYGEKSAKVMVEMTIGIKNAQTDLDSFVQSAQAAINKGDEMPGLDLANFLNAHDAQINGVEPGLGNEKRLSGDLLERAKKGREEFEEMYKNASPELQAFLSQTNLGESVQAMFLGIKPAVGLTTEHIEYLQGLNIKLPENFRIAGNFIYDKDQVREKMEQYPEVFNNFGEYENLDTYIGSLSFEFSSGEESMIRTGIILGYPEDTVQMFARNVNTAYIPFLDSLNDPRLREGLTESEVVALDNYNKDENNLAPSAYQNEIASIIEKKFSDMSEEGKKFILNTHLVETHGFHYRSGNPVSEDSNFKQQVETVFEQSGMNTFIQSVTQGEIYGDNAGHELKLNRDESMGVDTSWDVNFNRGALNIRGDMLTYTPNISRLKNPYNPGTAEYAYFEKYQAKFTGPEDAKKKDLIDEQRKRVERGIELATGGEVDGVSRKELTPEFWELMRANPNRISINLLQEFAYIGKNSAVKSVRPITYQVSNGNRLRDVDVNFKWNKARIDRYSLPAVQQKALEYLEQQVAQGAISSDLLTSARDVVESHKSQTSNTRAKIV